MSEQVVAAAANVIHQRSPSVAVGTAICFGQRHSSMLHSAIGIRLY